VREEFFFQKWYKNSRKKERNPEAFITRRPQ
jgi:hypothetical protein